MASRASELQDFLRQNAPTWQSHLTAVNEGVRRRISHGSDCASTPELFAQPGPSIVASSLDTASFAAVKSRNDFSPRSSNLPCTRKSTSLYGSRPGKRRHAIPLLARGVVLYDADAQTRLNDIVQHLTHALRLVRWNKQLSEMESKLREASDLCEDAAYQVLRDGDCAQYTTKALALLEEIYAMSRGALPAHDTHDEAEGSLSASETYEVKKPWEADILAVKDFGDNLDADSEQDLQLAPIRLTTRLAAR